MSFTGFPQAGIQFLHDLKVNNNREWFEAHKQDYITYLRDPAVALVLELGERLKALDADIRYDPSTNGSGSLLRVNRDTRFSKDKTPYKTNVSMMFWNGSGKKMEHPGFGFQFEATGGGGMGGIFTFTKTSLEAYRQAVLDEKTGQALMKVVETVTAAPGYTINGEEYKRVPAGYDADHPRS